jgi:hypothetical protein
LSRNGGWRKLYGKKFWEKPFMSIRPDKRQNQQPASNIRKARIPSDLTYETMSDLGRDLFDISRDYAGTGGELLSEEEIEVEIARRRGGYAEGDVA